jgi:hypothetical protein
MRQGRWALVVLLMAACGNGSTPSGQSATPTNPASVTPSASAQQSASSLPCRLPVVIRKFDPKTHTWSPDTTGFLTYPAGELISASGVGVRYDVSRGRWLPAGMPTPDGTGYVYSDAAGAVHVVSVDSGQDRVILPGAWAPIGFVGNVLYVAQERPITPGAFVGGGYTQGGLAETDLSGTTPTFVTQHSGPWRVSSLGGWTLDRADGMQQAPDRVLHVDLATGAVQPWLTGVGNAMLIGFDGGGHPFVVTDGGVRVVLVADSHENRGVYTGTPGNGWPESPYYVDGGNVWFSGFGIKDPAFDAPAWHYSPEAGLQPSVGVPGAQVSVAGPCVS